MLEFILVPLATLRAFIRTRQDNAIEILTLRQQLAVLKRKQPRPRLNSLDRLFWIAFRRVGTRWADLLVVAKPQTVVRWHRSGFRGFWKWRSRNRGGRPKTTVEIRALIRRFVQENPGWGAPRIHGEIEKLIVIVSERTVARCLRTLRRRGGSAQSWGAFLTNHRELIAAFDFFTLPTATFQLLSCFFVIEHHWRKILHCNVTAHPDSEWVVQQLREAFPEAGEYRHVIFDRDDTSNAEVVNLLKDAGLKPKRTSIASPWRNGIAGR